MNEIIFDKDLEIKNISDSTIYTIPSINTETNPIDE